MLLAANGEDRSARPALELDVQIAISSAARGRVPAQPSGEPRHGSGGRNRGGSIAEWDHESVNLAKPFTRLTAIADADHAPKPKSIRRHHQHRAIVGNRFAATLGNGGCRSAAYLPDGPLGKSGTSFLNREPYRSG